MFQKHLAYQFDKHCSNQDFRTVIQDAEVKRQLITVSLTKSSAIADTAGVTITSVHDSDKIVSLCRNLHSHCTQQRKFQ